MPHNKSVPLSNLQEKAKVLKASPLFSRTDELPLLEKQMIFLVLAGCKQVCEADSGHWARTSYGERRVPDDRNEVAKLLDSLGLVYDLLVKDTSTHAVVALDRQVLQQFWATRDATIGFLYGFPETAVKAFGQDRSMSSAQQDEIARKLDFDIGFRLSSDHWPEELAKAREWHQILKAYGLAAVTSK